MTDESQSVVRPAKRFGRDDSAIERGRQAMRSSDVREAYMQAPPPKGPPQVFRPAGEGIEEGAMVREWSVVSSPRDGEVGC